MMTCFTGQVVLQHEQKGCRIAVRFRRPQIAAENHEVVVYAAERRAPMHRTGTN
jgi:hypothetical protein